MQSKRIVLVVLGFIFFVFYCVQYCKADTSLNLKEKLQKSYESYEKLLVAEGLQKSAWANSLVGIASSMVKIHPEDIVPQMEITGEVNIALAKNEKESFQIVVVPFANGLKDAQVKIGELKDKNGGTFAADMISCDVVGYVKTYMPLRPSFGQYVGWWPDPILSFMDKTDIAKDCVQSFWVKIRTSRDTKAGDYSGKLLVTAADIAEPYSMDFSVRVYNFTLPDETPLPLAVDFRPSRNEQIAQTAEADYSPEKWKEKWQKNKFVWADFLADYFISYDSLYTLSPDWPDYEVIDYLSKKGKLSRFNLGAIGNGPNAGEDKEEYIANTLKILRSTYEKAKARGLLGRAYIYGFDERPKKDFPIMDELAKRFKQELSGVSVFTTAGAIKNYWGNAENIDMWCPLTRTFDLEKYEKYKAQGKEVWWYICVDPKPPYANVFIESRAIEIRLLMGAMTAKYKPDGFLYYSINRYNGMEWSKDIEMVKNERYVESGPFTEWNPKSYKASHGDGSWVYPGPDGLPLPSIRLENFRDGLEDYAYYRILEQTIAKMDTIKQLKPVQEKWLKQAKILLAVPQDIVKSLTEYTDNPDLLNRYRSDLANMIVTAPRIESATPD